MQSCMKLQWTDMSGVEIMSEVLRFLKTTHVIILKNKYIIVVLCTALTQNIKICLLNSFDSVLRFESRRQYSTR